MFYYIVLYILIISTHGRFNIYYFYWANDISSFLYFLYHYIGINIYHLYYYYLYILSSLLSTIPLLKLPVIGFDVCSLYCSSLKFQVSTIANISSPKIFFPFYYLIVSLEFIDFYSAALCGIYFIYWYRCYTFITIIIIIIIIIIDEFILCPTAALWKVLLFFY